MIQTDPPSSSFGPTQKCPCTHHTLGHALNQRIHYMYCSNYGMVSFNKQMWNRIIVAVGY